MIYKTTEDAPLQANRQCEHCAVVEMSQIMYDTDGKWHPIEYVRKLQYGEKIRRFGLNRKLVYIDLVRIHIDHDAKNNDPANIQLICRRCQMAHLANLRRDNRVKRQAGANS